MISDDYGELANRGFCRWRDKGIWDKLLDIYINDPDFSLVFYRFYVRKSTQSQCWCKKGAIRGLAHKRVVNNEVHMAVDSRYAGQNYIVQKVL